MPAITFLPEEHDYVSASRASYLLRLRTWRGISRIVILLLVAALAVTGIDSWESGRFDWIFFFELTGMYAALALAAVGFCVWRVRRKVRRMFAEQPAFAEPMTIAWDDDGIIVDSPITTHRIAWTRLFRWRETPREQLIFLTAAACVFVPKRAMTADDLADLGSRLATASRKS